MNVGLWILTALLAAAFLAAGGMKLAQPKEKLAASPNMAWAQDFSPGMLKTIGALEVLAANSTRSSKAGGSTTPSTPRSWTPGRTERSSTPPMTAGRLPVRSRNPRGGVQDHVSVLASDQVRRRC